MKKLISLLSVFLFPTLVFGWSSIEPYNTHNEVTLLALTEMPQDNTARLRPLPAANRILHFDQVHIKNGKLTGTSPDVGTNSKYSEHYFSPFLGWGEAPNSVARNFEVLLSSDPKSDTAAKAGAYAAHFLADMHVPYHVYGMPAEWAYDGVGKGESRIKPEITGPLFLYGGTPPARFGDNNDFSGALDNFVKHNTRGSDVDWFDAWYWNGVGKEKPLVPQEPLTATSSHGWWEFEFQSQLESQKLKRVWNQLIQHSQYDPGWSNSRVPAGADYRKHASEHIKQFTQDCATETAKGVKTYYDDPYYSMTRAARAVMTMFRASQTAIQIQKRENNDHLQYVITNLSPEESLGEPIVRVYADGSMVSEKTYDDIAAQGNLVIDSDIAKAKKIVVEVSGMYMDTPDLCYNRIEFAYVKPLQAQEDPEHTCMIPPGAEENRDIDARGGGEIHYYTLAYGRKNIFTRTVGPYKRYFSKDGQVQVDACYDENGKLHGWRTVYDRKGNIRGQALNEHGKTVFIKIEKGKLVNKKVK